MEQEFMATEIAILTRLKKLGFAPKVIYDIGSACCHWSIVVNRIFTDSKYHLFEPLAETDVSYKGFVEKYMPQFNWEVHPIALGTEEGQIDFFVKESPYGSTSLHQTNHEKFKKVIVPSATLENYMEINSLETPDFIKIDTQGAELNILKGKGAKLKGVQLLLLETWLHRAYGPETPLLHEIQAYLLPYGFFLFELAGEYRFKNGNLMSQDFFFVNQNSALATDYIF